MKQQWLDLMQRSGLAPVEQAQSLRRRLTGARGLRRGGSHLPAAAAHKSLAREFRRRAHCLYR